MQKISKRKVWFALSLLIFLPALAVIISQAYAQKTSPHWQRPLLVDHYMLSVKPGENPMFDAQIKIRQGDPIKPELKPAFIPAPAPAPVPATPPEIEVPLNDGVEDYSDVDEGVKRGVRRMGAWLVHEMGIHPVITSGKRSAKNNSEVKGSPRSWHLIGEAVDLGVGKLTPQQQATIRQKALDMGFEEVLYHDAGEGLHLHLAHMTRED